MMVENRREKTISVRKENLPDRNEVRVLILGSRLSGAFKLADDLNEFLNQRGIQPNVEVLRDAGKIETAIMGRDMIEQGKNNTNLPKGIILLPEMRQYSPTGMGMDLDTYSCGISDFVEELCKKLKIDLVEIREYKNPKQIEDGLKKLLIQELEK